MRSTSAVATSLKQRTTAAERLMSVRELAERLGVSTRQCWKLVSSGRLPAPVRLGRSVRWRESDILGFIDADCDMARFNAERKGGPA